MEDKHGNTPLHKAITSQRQQLALYFSLDSLKFLQKSVSRCATMADAEAENDDNNNETGDKHSYDKNSVNLLLLAITQKCPKVADAIISTIQENEQNKNLLQLLTFNDGRNALTMAPRCSATFLKKLLHAYPKFITQCDAKSNGQTLLHCWISMDCVWAIEYIIKTEDINPQSKSSFIDLLCKYNRDGKQPLHLIAASELGKEMVDIVNFFLDASFSKSEFITLWSTGDDVGNTPLQIAISNRCEELALLFMSMDQELDNIGEDIMFKAIDHECHKVVKFLLEWSIQHKDCYKFLKSNGVHNVLHVACKSTEENGRLIVDNWPELINENDNSGKKPLEKASEAGKAWLVKLILQEDRSSIEKTPLAWVEACKNGHVSTILAFVQNSPYFRSICHQQKDTPLHHIGNASYKQYQQLLKHQFINELENTKNKSGKTPLHIAIESENKDLAEILLTTDGLDWNLKDNTHKSAKDLLKVKCKNNPECDNMCKLIGVHHLLKAIYIDAKTNLMEMRGTISVVATLLATITITAGFAVPGGIDSNGDAVLSGTWTFWVFVLSNTYAMCCAILILFCDTWSMVSDNDKALRLIDRSLWLLKQSLYGTLVAFTVAMYTVIHKKSLWAAIVVAVMVFIVVVLAQRAVVYKVLNMFKYFEDNPPRVLTRPISFSLRGSSTERATLLSATSDLENPATEVEGNISTIAVV